MSEHEIRFYRVRDPYGEFSNFAPFPIDIDGMKWPTSEHFFQAQKFARPEEQELIRRESSPHGAAKRGRDRRTPLRPDWESVKDEVMRCALRAKFTQHDQLRQLLLETGDAVLIEHTSNDSYWGDGGDGTGRNRLGELLMAVRCELRAADKSSGDP
jgi:ribA/ribD-fused uncharacterized protein